MRPGPRRAMLVAAASALLLAWEPADAQAHTRTQETTNVVSTITDAPEIDPVSWTVHTGGLLIEVHNGSDGTLIVEGYDGEPYLRIGPEGVQRNRHSPATYLNDERFAAVTLPPVVDPDAEPGWVQISDEPRALWHDHRTHWMSPRPPDVVHAGPIARAAMRLELVGPIGTAGDAQGDLHRWEVPLTYEGQPVVLRGTLAWQDPPPAWPWLVMAALLVLPGLLGLRGTSPVQRIRPAALVVGAVAGLNAIHLVDDLVAFPGPLLDELFGVLHTGLFLSIGLGGAAWAWWSDSGRRLALGIASGAVLYHQGLVHLPILAASQFPTIWPDGLVRLTVALGLAQAALVAAVLADRSPAPVGASSADAPRHARGPVASARR